MMGKIIIIVAVGAVAAVLFAGIAVMAIGGPTAAKWSNVLMRYRIVAQVVALLVIALVFFLTTQH